MRRATIHLLASILVLPMADARADGLRRPNVIVLLTDDNGYGDLSCHGNPVLKTPNFDRLHDAAIRLTDFHVAPMCTPTRGQLLTGLDALHSRASSVCAGRSFIPRGVPTMAESFAAAGYRTGIFGKWHLGDSYPNLPHQRGFQEAVYFHGFGVDSIAAHWGNDNFDDTYFHNGRPEPYRGYCTDVWFDQAMEWIKRGGRAGEPFFVYLPTNAAHGPPWVPEKYKAPYRGKGPAAFFGMIANLDENLGRLDDFLRANGLFDDTILIYMNDNGGTAGVRLYNAGMRGHKTEYYEGGHRAACFIRWPGGGLRAPSDVDALTEVQDLFPTLLDLCQVPKTGIPRLDGTSLAPLLKDPKATLPDRTLVVQYGQRPVKWDSAVMRGRWRLVKGEELYDLRTDPGQTRDVATAHPAMVSELRNSYESWWRGVEPTLEDLSPISIGSDREDPVTLTSVDWANVYCDNLTSLRTGLNRNGPWHLLVERAGSYEIELRRWPKEADLPMTAGAPPFIGFDPTPQLPAGKAMPIARVRLRIGETDETKPVAPVDRGVRFSVKLEAGARILMQGWFYDSAGQELSGAYYAYVHRRSE